MKRIIQPAGFRHLVSYSLIGTRLGIYRLAKTGGGGGVRVRRRETGKGDKAQVQSVESEEGAWVNSERLETRWEKNRWKRKAEKEWRLCANFKSIKSPLFCSQTPNDIIITELTEAVLHPPEAFSAHHRSLQQQLQWLCIDEVLMATIRRDHFRWLAEKGLMAGNVDNYDLYLVFLTNSSCLRLSF